MMCLQGVTGYIARSYNIYLRESYIHIQYESHIIILSHKMVIFTVDRHNSMFACLFQTCQYGG